MSMFSQNYDRPNYQARAVVAYLDAYDGVEPSWNKEFHRYDPVTLAEWHNGRESGYVLSMRKFGRTQINIAFFEHRNSDNICAIKWEQMTLNPPTIETAEFKGQCYSDKWDVSHTVGVGEAYQMAEWIMEQLCEWWAAE